MRAMRNMQIAALDADGCWLKLVDAMACRASVVRTD
jgi:hypothetical protein